MPCHARSVCRQAPQFLWVTDDILAEAFNRFARVSNAHRRKAEGRRYGSHVPGPLEAHRRSSKRRIGLQAAPSSVPSSGLDLGSLFGLGGFTSESRIDDWRWQPPGEDKHQQPERWLFASKSNTKKEAWEAFLGIPESSPEEAVEKSKQAFDDLWAKSEDTEALFAFLRTAENEPEARNTLRMAEWLSPRHCDNNDLRAFDTLVKEKVRLQTLADGELASIIALMLHRDFASGQAAAIAGLLDEVASEGELVLVCSSVTQALLKDVQAERRLSPHLELWLRVLRTTSCLKADHFDNPVWTRMYDLLASEFPNFAILKDHLSTLKRLDLSRVLLKHWTPRTTWGDSAASTDMTITAAGSWKWLARPGHRRPHVTRLLADFESLASQYATRRERASGFTSLAQAVALLHHHGIPHVKFCHGIFDILMHSASAGSVHRIIYGITHHAGIGIDQELASSLIQYFISRNRVDHATKVFHAVPALPLSACYELPITLAKEYPCSAAQIWGILKRLTPEDVDVRAKGKRNQLSPDHVDLIHLVAFYFANSPLMTPRSAYRRVWECYIFLRDRMADVKPMMTRAFVMAGVVRPLKALQRVSTVKFRYVLKLVARIEGRDVAEDLDRLVWKTWKRSILPRIRARRVLQSLEAALNPKSELHAVRRRLITATRDFRKGRLWLFPERLSERRNARLQDAAHSQPVHDAVHILDATAITSGEQDAHLPVELKQRTASGQPLSNEIGLEPMTATGLWEDPGDIETHLDVTARPQTDHDQLQRSLHPVPLSTSPTNRSGLGYNAYEPSDFHREVDIKAEPEVSFRSTNDARRKQPTTPSSMDRFGLYPDGMTVSQREKAVDVEPTTSAVPKVAPAMLVSVARKLGRHTPVMKSPDDVDKIKNRHHIVEDKGRPLNRATKRLKLYDKKSIQWKSVDLDSLQKKAMAVPTAKYSPELAFSPLELLVSETRVVGRTHETEEVARRVAIKSETPTQQGFEALPTRFEPQAVMDDTNKQFKSRDSRAVLFSGWRPLSEVELCNLYTLEMQCWEKLVSSVGDRDRPTPDFLRWRRCDDGRLRLFMEWRGSWQRLAKRWQKLLLFRDAGWTRLEEALSRRFAELHGGVRVEIEDDGGPLRGPDGKTTRLSDPDTGVEAGSNQVVGLCSFIRRKKFSRPQNWKRKTNGERRGARMRKGLEDQEAGKRKWQLSSRQWRAERKMNGSDLLRDKL